jgi:GNAT superfamily N-acetyltransferase
MANIVVDLKEITPQQALPLRGQVLRAGLPLSASVYPSDTHPQNYIAAALLDGDIVGIATVFPESPPGEDRPGAWRLRGMAVREDLRGQGIGALVLRNCIEEIRSQGGVFLWCNARTPVLHFYRKLGFETIGEEFDIPVSGPHYFMTRTIP